MAPTFEFNRESAGLIDTIQRVIPTIIYHGTFRIAFACISSPIAALACIYVIDLRIIVQTLIAASLSVDTRTRGDNLRCILE